MPTWVSGHGAGFRYNAKNASLNRRADLSFVGPFFNTLGRLYLRRAGGRTGLGGKNQHLAQKPPNAGRVDEKTEFVGWLRGMLLWSSQNLMMRVLADDISGAAEIAGVGFRYGLKATVQLDPGLAPASDLAVLDIDSRCKSRADAVRLVQSALDQKWSFKKIDSVLRGHVLAEIQPFLESGLYRRALVVPFNPELGRTIEGGIYQIHDNPISQTPFRDDPEYPVLKSEVRAMVGAESVPVCRLSDPLPDAGVIVGEGQTPDDLRGWANRIDEGTLPVGGAPFFAAWLEMRGKRIAPSESQQYGGKVLVVSGTTSPVVNWQGAFDMPESVFDHGSQEAFGEWMDRIARALESTGFAVGLIGSARLVDSSRSARLVGHLGDLAASILARCRVDQLWLEGGATASRVIRKIGWTSLDIVGELAPGVVQLCPASGVPLIVIKPGSYPWPRRSF